jgi:hypothetical protein
MTRPLRVPLALTWTALTGAAAVLAASCGGGGESSSQPSAPDSATAADVALETATPVGEAGSDVTREGSSADVAMNDPDAGPSVECEMITDAALVLFYPDGNTCPDGDMAIPIV